LRWVQHTIVHFVIDLQIIKELLFLLLPLEARENALLLGADIILGLIQHLIRRHICVEDVADGQAAAVVLHLDCITLHDVVFFSHATIFVLVGHDLILNFAKLFIEIVYLIAHVFDVLHDIIGLLFLLLVFFFRVLILVPLVLFLLARLLELPLVALHKVLQLFDMPLELDDLAMPL